jgi:peptidoglycan/xylan/chitin deacetylase (PgdA/CDA1 family)
MGFMDRVYVLVTMDVERPRLDKNASGPENWDASAAYIRGYTEQAAAHGFPVSFFAHPETAVRHAELFERLRQDHGAFTEGLHLHPWKFADGRYPAHLGGMTGDEQREAISEAAAMWRDAFQREPRYFRPGTFSANDETFQVLVDLGFRGGSISAPGRVYRELNSIWTGAVPDPHRAHRCFRQLEGDLEFANIPLTADFSEQQQLDGRIYYRDLRPDYRGVDYEPILRNIVNQLVERQPDIPVIQFVTHNDNDYTDPNDPNCINYETVLKGIGEACSRVGLESVGATIGEVCDLVLAKPANPPEFLAAYRPFSERPRWKG